VRSIQVDQRSLELEEMAQPVQAQELGPAPAADGETPWAVALSATGNDSFSTVFAALGKGLEVSRLQQPLTVGEQTLAVGSFLVRTPSRGAFEGLMTGHAGSALLLPQAIDDPGLAVAAPRIALVETWFHDMDAGWTRFVFDRHNVPYQVLRPGEIADTDLVAQFDVLVLPDSDAAVLKQGKYEREGRYFAVDYPPDYTKGIGDEGMKRLIAFLEGGGVIVSWRRSTELFFGDLEAASSEPEGEAESFALPIRDASKGATEKGLFVPGAFLKIDLNPDHPVAWGMPAKAGVFSRGVPVFRTSIPTRDMDRRVVAAYPERDLLLSGYIEGEEGLARTPALVWLRKGEGQLVLFNFNPQFRASTPATYKLLFNALLLPDADTVSTLIGG
jgi:hypothetical protein